MFYFLLGVLLIGVCVIAFKKPQKKPESVTQIKPVAQMEAAKQQPVIRSYVPGPTLTRDDDAFYAVVHAAIAQTLAMEGINPEGGFAIRKIKPVRNTDPVVLSLKENEALYAVVMAAVGQTLSSEGVNPEGGFAIRSITPITN